jgi:hypothetical protein
LENPFKAIKGRLQLYLKAQNLCLLACLWRPVRQAK